MTRAPHVIIKSFPSQRDRYARDDPLDSLSDVRCLAENQRKRRFKVTANPSVLRLSTRVRACSEKLRAVA